MMLSLILNIINNILYFTINLRIMVLKHMKPTFYVKFEPEEDIFNEQNQSIFLQNVKVFAEKTNMKARMIDENDISQFSPGINIVIKMTGSVKPEEYSKIIEDIYNFIEEKYPQKVIEINDKE